MALLLEARFTLMSDSQYQNSIVVGFILLGLSKNGG
jgi:hypothetical protein